MTQTLKRDKGDQESRPYKGGGTDLVAEDGCDDDQLEGPGPEVVIEQNGRVKPANFIDYNLDGSQSCLVADLLTSFDKRFTIWPIVVLPRAELESFRAFL